MGINIHNVAICQIYLHVGPTLTSIKQKETLLPMKRGVAPSKIIHPKRCDMKKSEFFISWKKLA
jgi:hypothetical protein